MNTNIASLSPLLMSRMSLELERSRRKGGKLAAEESRDRSGRLVAIMEGGDSRPEVEGEAAAERESFTVQFRSNPMTRMHSGKYKSLTKTAGSLHDMRGDIGDLLVLAESVAGSGGAAAEGIELAELLAAELDKHKQRVGRALTGLAKEIGLPPAEYRLADLTAARSDSASREQAAAQARRELQDAEKFVTAAADQLERHARNTLYERSVSPDDLSDEAEELTADAVLVAEDIRQHGAALIPAQGALDAEVVLQLLASEH